MTHYLLAYCAINFRNKINGVYFFVVFFSFDIRKQIRICYSYFCARFFLKAYDFWADMYFRNLDAINVSALNTSLNWIHFKYPWSNIQPYTFNSLSVNTLKLRRKSNVEELKNLWRFYSLQIFARAFFNYVDFFE